MRTDYLSGYCSPKQTTLLIVFQFWAYGDRPNLLGLNELENLPKKIERLIQNQWYSFKVKPDF